MFTDKVTLYLKAGDGGAGSVAFRREKHVPRGGPSGGDGGDGGSITLVSDPSLRDLAHLARAPHHKASKGHHGEGSHKHGARGDDITLHIPVGTQVYEDGLLIADLLRPGQKVCVASGGEGGAGNARFTTSTQRAPRFAQLGLPGEERTLQLQLKLLADIGLAGFPNAGKSSLLRRLSRAKPKVASYPFTTLEPMLGIAQMPSGEQFSIADIPGLIEGAASGAGLGHRFLAHLERTQLLLYVIDISPEAEQEPLEAFRILRRELAAYATQLSDRPGALVLNKVDLVEPPALEEHRQRFLKELAALEKDGSWSSFPKDSEPLFFVSALTGQGTNTLLEALGKTIASLAPSDVGPQEAAREHRLYRPGRARGFSITLEGGVARVKNERAQKLCAQTDLGNPQALAHLNSELEKLGLTKALRRAGVKEGDTVLLGNLTFTFSDILTP